MFGFEYLRTIQSIAQGFFRANRQKDDLPSLRSMIKDFIKSVWRRWIMWKFQKRTATFTSLWGCECNGCYLKGFRSKNPVYNVDNVEKSFAILVIADSLHICGIPCYQQVSFSAILQKKFLMLTNVFKSRK